MDKNTVIFQETCLGASANPMENHKNWVSEIFDRTAPNTKREEDLQVFYAVAKE